MSLLGVGTDFNTVKGEQYGITAHVGAVLSSKLYLRIPSMPYG